MATSMIGLVSATPGGYQYVFLANVVGGRTELQSYAVHALFVLLSEDHDSHCVELLKLGVRVALPRQLLTLYIDVDYW